MVRYRTVLPVLLVHVLVPGIAGAQTARYVRGSVADSSGTPLPGAAVAVVGAERQSATFVGATGRFVLCTLVGVRLVAARIGFAPETLTAGPGQDSLRFRLRAAPVQIDPISVAADRATSAASASYISQLDIAIRARESSQELLRMVPGLVIAQHAGGGKAEQIFLRGFDADHGTDVAVSVDGTPVNMVSHAHGQGYADLHWLMPEVVSGLDVRKGPYDAADGDFATAGAVTFNTLDRLNLEGPRVEARGGSYGTAHATALVPFGGDAEAAGGFLAGAFHRADGPFENAQDYRRYNLFGKFTTAVSPTSELVLSADGFGAAWNGSGQVPERALAAGLIGRFGSVDPFEGGATQRQDVSVALRSTQGGRDHWDVRAFAAHYHLTLYSDFTFFLHDTLNGDGIQQYDERILAGLRATFARMNTVFGKAGSWDVGGGTRNDWNDLRLSHQRHRVVLERRVDDGIRENAFYAWARQTLDVTSRLRLSVGLRGDLLRFDVRDRLIGVDTTALHASGSRWQGVVSPKFNLAYEVAPGTTFFLNAAGGFHSNDARDVILASSADRVLPRALGSEVGVRHTWSGGSVSAAAWLLDLQSELVYSGDDGTTRAAGRTRRIGLDLGGRAQLRRGLWADADVNLSRGRLRDAPRGANLIPLAPAVVGSAGLTVRDLGAVGGGLRVRHVGSRAANEDNSIRARGYTLTEIYGSWRLARAELRLSADNLFNVDWNEAQFDTQSRLPGEGPAGVDELHFTPGSPRSVQLGVAYRF